MRIRDGLKLDFQDVLIVPQRSSLSSRADVDLMRTYKFPHSDRVWTGIGIISANMDSTGTIAMANEFSKHNMLVALHKHYTIDQLVKFFSDKAVWDCVFYTVGTSVKDIEKLCLLKSEMLKNFSGPEIKEFPHFINIDVANGYQESFVETVKEYRKFYPQSVIMAGNVCTPNMTEELILSGADISKIGLGCGSACQTRIKAGVGFPQFSAIDECSYVAHGLGGHICSDGGCASSGDVAKAFAVGGDFVMLGGMLSATDECEGAWARDESGVPISFKFYGMSSTEAQEKYNGGLADHRASEGKCVYLPYRGKVENIIKDILGGVRSACTYVGAERLKDLPKCAEFVRVNSQYNKVFDGKEK